MSQRRLIIRIVVDLVIFIATIEGWWFVALPVAILCSWVYRPFVEILVAGLAYDSLFGHIQGVGLWAYMGTLVSVIIFLFSSITRHAVRGIHIQ